MPLELGPLFVENSLGLFAFLILVPFIILYLIKPRPKELVIPSLMFFLQDRGQNRTSSFLKTFARDYLFLIQLLALLLLAAAVANPYTFYDHDVTSANTILVIDVSASSQAYYGGKTRFELMKEKAFEVLGGKNTIILAKERPVSIAQDLPSSEAATILQSVNPSDSLSAIGDAIVFAGDVLGQREGRVIVLSDFENTGGIEPEIAKNILASRGIVTDFIPLASPSPNIGIIDVAVDDDASIVYLKNYNKEPKSITLSLGATRSALTIGPGSIEPYGFLTPPGITRIQIEDADAFPTDNVAYVSAPELKPLRILYITNNASFFLRAALNATKNIEIEIAEPPIVPKGDYELYVIQNIDPEKILAGTFTDLEEKVKSGASIIIHAQKDMDKINYGNMLPITMNGKGNAAPIIVNQENALTKDIDFGQTRSYLTATPKKNVISLASAQNSTVLAFASIGRGKLLYYGLSESDSEFRLAPSYPVFWSNVLKFLTDQADISFLNMKVGQTLVLEKPTTIKTPTKTIEAQSVVLDKIGIYEASGKKIAVNLASDAESDVGRQTTALSSQTQKPLEPVTESRELYFELIFAVIALAMVILELFYIKLRGDV